MAATLMTGVTALCFVCWNKQSDAISIDNAAHFPHIRSRTPGRVLVCFFRIRSRTPGRVLTRFPRIRSRTPGRVLARLPLTVHLSRASSGPPGGEDRDRQNYGDDGGACRGRARRQQSLGNNLLERAEGVPVGNSPSATISWR